MIGKIKVTLYFKNGGSMTFKCKKFSITKSNERVGYSEAEWEFITSTTVTFAVTEVIAVKMVKVLF